MVSLSGLYALALARGRAEKKYVSGCMQWSKVRHVEAEEAEVAEAPASAPAAAMEAALAAVAPMAETEVAAASAPAPAPEPPDEYLCPISHELMEDPVFATDGHTYERREIERWFQKKLTSPKTSAPLETSAIFPNHVLRRLIIEWCEAHSI